MFFEPSQALPRQLPQRGSQAVKFSTKALGAMRKHLAVLLPLPLRKDFPRSGGRCRAATKGGVWHRAAMTERAHAVRPNTPSVSLRSPAPPRGRLMALPETLPPPPKAVPLGKVAATKGSRRKGFLPPFAKNCIFRKFVLDNRPTFRYNRARSRGKMPHELERSWPGSSVG